MPTACRAVAVTPRIGRACEFVCNAFTLDYWELARGREGESNFVCCIGSQRLKLLGSCSLFLVGSHRGTTNKSSSSPPPPPKAAGGWVQPAQEPGQLLASLERS